MTDTMSKNPALDTSGQPRCYGLCYAENRILCAPCKFKRICAPRTAAWEAKKSLSQLVEEAVTAVTGFGVGGSFADIYARCYERLYGTPLWSGSLEKPRAKMALEKAESFCSCNRIDRELWITSQMVCMLPFLNAAKERGARFCSFAPNMLLGKKAEHRYNTYIQRTNRRNRTVRVDGTAGENILYQTIGELAHEESRLLWFMVESKALGEAVTLSSAAKELEMTAGWMYAAGLTCGVPGATKDEVWQLEKVKVAGILQGAWNCATGYHYTLPDRLGINLPFDHEAFAEIVARLYPRKPSRTGSVASKLGVSWPMR